MNTTADLIGVSVKYVGKNRDGLRDLVGVVQQVTENDAVGVLYPDGIAEAYKSSNNGLVWANRWAWNKVESIRQVAESTDLDSVFTSAAGGTRAVLVAEINRLKARLNDLQHALEVIDTL